MTFKAVLKFNPHHDDKSGQFTSADGGGGKAKRPYQKMVQVYGLSRFPRTDEPGASPEALMAAFLKGRRRDFSVRRTGADFHDAAATANEAAAEAYRHGHDAKDLTIRAQTASGDAGGSRKDIFRAEEVGTQGKYEKAAELHAKQAAYHRAKAANWRKQVV